MTEKLPRWCALKTHDAVTVEMIKPDDDPDEWHRLVRFGNYDLIDVEALRAIAEMPNCDKATALVIFWNFGPDFFLTSEYRAEPSDFFPDDFELLDMIRKRWEADGYSRAELEFDMLTDANPFDFADLDKEFGADQIAKSLPLSMRAPLVGRQIGQDGRRFPGVPA